MTEKILVVEDDGILASTLKLKLESWGYEVPKIALTGNEAVEKAKNIYHDLIIMDIDLKGKLDGIETSKLIDADYKTPIIYYSSKNDDELSKRVKKLDNRDYIQKTDKDEHLKSAIKNQLKNRDSKLDNKEFTAQTDDKIISEVVNPQNQDVEVTGDDNLNKIISTEENDTLSRTVEEFQNQGYVKIKSVDGNLKPVIEKKEGNVTYIEPSENKTNDDVSSKNYSDEYNKTRQKIEYELQNLETHFFKASDKAASQEIEIKKLKKVEVKYINSINEKDKKIEELGEHQKKLEEELNIYKNQRQKMLDEVCSLKKQIDTLLPILNGK